MTSVTRAAHLHIPCNATGLANAVDVDLADTGLGRGLATAINSTAIGAGASKVRTLYHRTFPSSEERHPLPSLRFHETPLVPKDLIHLAVEMSVQLLLDKHLRITVSCGALSETGMV